MTNPVLGAWAWLQSDEVLFSPATPNVGRVFMACKDCGRVRPAYEIVMKAGTYKRLWCYCGSRYHKPVNLPTWRAAWWLLIVGVVWRKWVRRLPNWDPRMPCRVEP